MAFVARNIGSTLGSIFAGGRWQDIAPGSFVKLLEKPTKRTHNIKIISAKTEVVSAAPDKGSKRKTRNG